MQFHFYCYVLLDPTKPGKFNYSNFDFDFEPFYIGKGSGNRMNSHDKPTCKNTHKNNKIRKLISINLLPIKIKLVDNLDEKEAFKKEIELIELIGRLDIRTGILVNLTDGGEGTINPSEETRKKIGAAVSLSKKGKSYDEIYGLEKSLKIKANKSKWTKENFNKTGLGMKDFSGNNNPMYGKSVYSVWELKFGKEIANQKLESLKNKKIGKTPWNKNNKKIIQKDVDGNLIKLWDGLFEISDTLNFNKPNICKVLNQERKTAHGFIWEYYN